MLPSHALYCSDSDTAFYLGECVIKALKLNLFRYNFSWCIFHRPLSGGYFRPCGPQLRVRVCLREVKNVLFDRRNRRHRSLVSAYERCQLVEVRLYVYVATEINYIRSQSAGYWMRSWRGASSALPEVPRSLDHANLTFLKHLSTKARFKRRAIAMPN